MGHFLELASSPSHIVRRDSSRPAFRRGASGVASLAGTTASRDVGYTCGSHQWGVARWSYSKAGTTGDRFERDASLTTVLQASELTPVPVDV